MKKGELILDVDGRTLVRYDSDVRKAKTTQTHSNNEKSGAITHVESLISPRNSRQEASRPQDNGKLPVK